MSNFKTDWDRLRQQTDEDIAKAVTEDPDTFFPDESFWQTAEVVMPQRKQQITLKLDPEIIAYFKTSGRGYNTRINAVLKSYVEKVKKQAS